VYEEFFGLRERPFDLNTDPRFIFMSSGHREALSNLEYGLSGRKAMTLLLGDAGLGKTTLVRAVVRGMAETDAQCVYVSNPALTRNEFIRLIATGFELSQEAASNKTICLEELERKLLDRLAADKITALVIDEAQSIPIELLEEIRLLGNMETDNAKLLPIILAGQPELSARLNEPSLRQLKQRVALRCELKPLTLQETAAYMATRIRVAGGQAKALFTRDAVATVHGASKGIPRIISVLSDNALVAAYAQGVRPVRRSIVEEVCADFDTTVPAGSASMAGLLGSSPAPSIAPWSRSSVVKLGRAGESQALPVETTSTTSESVGPDHKVERSGLFSVFTRRGTKVASD
jgi:general secretion pathway protein A